MTVSALEAALVTAGIYGVLLVLLAALHCVSDEVELPRPAVWLVTAVAFPAWAPLWLGGRIAEWLLRWLR